jgi:hypothetical protein
LFDDPAVDAQAGAVWDAFAGEVRCDAPVVEVEVVRLESYTGSA